MKMNYRIPAIIALLLAFPTIAGAESLTDADVRALYKEAQDAIRNPSKTVEIMKGRLDDSFLLVAHSSRTLGNAPAENGEEKMTKTQLLQNTIQAYNMIKIEDYQQNLLDVKFSDDKKWAYVSQTTIMRGSIQVNMPNNKTGTSVYTDREACVDTLGLVGSTLKIMRSECRVETKLAPPQ